MRHGDRPFFAEEGRGGLPALTDEAMADIALVFHWPPAALAAMSLSELMSWRAQAAKRWQKE